MSPTVLVIMGVSGSGKTTLGTALAHRLGWQFADADDFHSPANVAKMHSGIPLTDDDRAPWLATLHELIRTRIAQRQPTVLACSALKRSYRDILGSDIPAEDLRFIYLRVTHDELARRLHARVGHYMPESLLASQLATLEEPTADEALIVDASGSPAQTLEAITRSLSI